MRDRLQGSTNRARFLVQRTVRGFEHMKSLLYAFDGDEFFSLESRCERSGPAHWLNNSCLAAAPCSLRVACMRRLVTRQGRGFKQCAVRLEGESITLRRSHSILACISQLLLQ